MAQQPTPPPRRIPALAPVLLFLLGVTFFLSLWHTKVTGAFSPKAAWLFALMALHFLLSGGIFLKVVSRWVDLRKGLCLQFLCGCLCTSTLLFLLAVATPFSIKTLCLGLFAAGLLLALLYRGAARESLATVDPLPNLLCLLLCGVGATLWCADLLTPPSHHGGITIYHAWSDSFIHAADINIFSKAHGLKSIPDLKMAGAPAAVYHYASYVLPAVVKAFSGTSAYQVFASFYVPLGILLTGLAAFCLVGSIWGAWPGLAATLAVAWFPDAYQQGFQNKYMGCHFLQQVTPGGLYGVSVVALAWMFLLHGCKNGRLGAVFLGYVFGAFSLLFKAHYFVANAFLLMMYPCLFFSGVTGKVRACVATVFFAVFLAFVSFSQRLDAIPTLRLDGSGAGPFARNVLSACEPGPLRDFFCQRLLAPHPCTISLHFYLGVMLLACVFGVWVVVAVALSRVLKPKTDAAAFWFPYLVLANYLVMSLGLALDAKKISWEDELLHRPLVWAYFAVAAWAGGGLYMALFGDQPPKQRGTRILLGVVVLSSLFYPIVYSHNLETLPIWADYSTHEKLSSLPTALAKACVYVRNHSRSDETVQDSENDGKYMVTALSERQAFALDTGLRLREPVGLSERFQELARLKQMTDEKEIAAYLVRNRVAWYVLRPESQVAWPPAFLEKAVFSQDGVRVFHFPP